MWYDFFVAAVLIVSMVRGAMRGVIWQLAGIVGLVLCLVFAETISAAFGPHVGLAEPLNHWVVMFGAYLVFSFISFGFARMIHSWLEQAKMTEFDRHLGTVFGLLKGIAFCLVLTFFIVTLSDDARAMLKHSRSGRAAAIIMDRLHPIMPEKIRASLDKYIHQLDSPDLPLKYGHDHDHSGENDLDIFTSPVTPNVNQPGQNSNPRITPAPSQDPWDFSQNSNGTQINPIDEIIRRLPSFNQQQGRTIVEQAVQNTPPEYRDQLIDSLKTAAPTMIITVASQWLGQGSQSGNVQPATTSQTTTNDLTRLIQDIASQYPPAAQGQSSIASRVESAVRGLPESIMRPVLEDWRADVTGTQPDPDTSTTAQTSVDQRIISQLTIQRVPVYQLSDSMQQRLRAAAQR
ncbi:MAG: CvpA family protein [Planctomycetaceae bacterium]|nr:CvpA family protein [Planctomycetaceae bacterium]